MSRRPETIRKVAVLSEPGTMRLAVDRLLVPALQKRRRGLVVEVRDSEPLSTIVRTLETPPSTTVITTGTQTRAGMYLATSEQHPHIRRLVVVGPNLEGEDLEGFRPWIGGGQRPLSLLEAWRRRTTGRSEDTLKVLAVFPRGDAAGADFIERAQAEGAHGLEVVSILFTPSKVQTIVDFAVGQ
jgi:hypothetical protein